MIGCLFVGMCFFVFLNLSSRLACPFLWILLFFCVCNCLHFYLFLFVRFCLPVLSLCITVLVSMFVCLSPLFLFVRLCVIYAVCLCLSVSRCLSFFELLKHYYACQNVFCFFCVCILSLGSCLYKRSSRQGLQGPCKLCLVFVSRLFFFLEFTMQSPDYTLEGVDLYVS